jgi:hypothetical protein
VTEQDPLFKAYDDFREQVDMTASGILPDPDELAFFLLMGVPEVPADRDSSDEAAEEAIDQRILILKKVFVEINLGQDEAFIDQGLAIYEQGRKKAKALLEEEKGAAIKKRAKPDPEPKTRKAVDIECSGKKI